MASLNSGIINPFSAFILLVSFLASCLCIYNTWKLQWPLRRRSCGCALRHPHPPLPPGRLGLPWLGEGLQYISAMRAGDPDRFMHDRAARYASPTFKTVIFGQRIVMVQGASANRFLAASENSGILRNSWPTTVLTIVGEHAPIAKHGNEHRRFRQILASCLSPLALHKLVGKASLITQHHFDTHWRQQGTAHYEHRRLILLPLIKLHTFRIACNLLANVNDEEVLCRLHAPFSTWLAGMLDVPLDFPGLPYHKARLALNVLRGEMGKLIDAKLGKPHEQHAVDAGGDVDLMSLLLTAQDEQGSVLNFQETQDVLLFLLFAGHDTNTTALAFTLKFLEQNPACYDCVVQEQEAIASKKAPGEELNWADVQQMKYTWRVIQETIRLRPPVLGGMKEAMEDVIFDNYLIPKGWKVFFSISRTHHDNKYFPKASEFDPSRFESEQKLKETMNGRPAVPPPFAFVPFGVGPHSCPGNEFAKMTLCLYIHHLVRRYKWKSVYPDEKVEIFTMPSLAKGYPATVYDSPKFL